MTEEYAGITAEGGEEKPQWYVVHTYSGYENKVKANIEKLVENRNMQDQIFEVVVPVQDQIETKNGVKKTVSRKVFPGYVLLRMFMNDDTWYVVRNTRGVTSFVGPGSKPVPLSEDEVKMMGVNAPIERIDLSVGDMIRIIDGPFEDSTATIKDVLPHKRSVVATFTIFGRETPVELEYSQVQKVR